MYDVKNFTPIDLALLRRVAARGLSLDVVAILENANPLEAALLHIVGLKGRGRPTYILRTEYGEFAAQMRLENTAARITLLAPAPKPDGVLPPWLALLDAMVRQAGRRGAHLITAEVSVESPAFELFRQAGFTVYSRESLYCLAHHKVSELVEISHPRLEVRPIEEDDDARLYALYASTVPQLAQQVIPAPHDGWEGLAVILNDRVMGCLAVYAGKQGLLLQPYLHPELYDSVPQIFGQALSILPPQKIYVRLHAYQEWLRQSLIQDFGFEEQARYALMARHTVIKRETHVFSPLVALEQAFAPNPNIEIAWEITLHSDQPASLKK